MAIRTEPGDEKNLDSAYRTFLEERDASKKEQAGRNLIRAIFGKDAIADEERGTLRSAERRIGSAS
jgi:hypothetical protein